VRDVEHDAPRARQRFGAIAGALAATSEAGALRTGFAELTADETAAELIARADSQLIHSRSDTGTDTDAPRRATDWRNGSDSWPDRPRESQPAANMLPGSWLNRAQGTQTHRSPTHTPDASAAKGSPSPTRGR